MKSIALLALALAFPSFSHANDFSLSPKWLNIGGVSEHRGVRLDNKKPYNESNFGLGLELDCNHCRLFDSVHFGAVKNSYDNWSFIAAGFSSIVKQGRFDFGLTAALMTGYPAAVVVPAVLPMLKADFGLVGFNFGYSPSMRLGGAKVSNDTLIFQLKFTIR